ncbi:hypothetical protein [Arthrobacter sp. VKM Ac-2550]|uniref:hypothetical protein n=1 Tax=Crystallibacter permensis TaxID=1938888 RepID=UPI002227BA35|nr:hypothetical protein [Arthrobacter sp. VKM Ac-2550]MCW2132199.1 hypothetical protein [Arthrobacter sp. VKM Ac-2550]
MATTQTWLQRSTAKLAGRGRSAEQSRSGQGAQDPGPEPLINSLRTVYPEARISTPSRNKIRLELPSGDVLRFYVNP